MPRLQNQDIWLAYPKLVELSRVTLPIEASLGIGRLMKVLQPAYVAIENERRVLVTRYGRKDKATGQITVGSGSRQAGEYAVKFGGLLSREWGEELRFERVRLPLEMSTFCPGCGHEMNITFLIEPQMLMPLAEHFVEVVKE